MQMGSNGEPWSSHTTLPPLCNPTHQPPQGEGETVMQMGSNGEPTSLLSSLFSWVFLESEAMEQEVEALELEFQLGDLSDVVTPAEGAELSDHGGEPEPKVCV